MGRSRRKLKKTMPKVRVGMGHLKRKRNEKTQLPLELTEDRPDIVKRFGARAEWAETKTLTANYEANQLVLDPNRGFGRNAQAAEPLKDAEERHAAGQDTHSDDDELRAGCNLTRHTGKALPPRLTAKQKQLIERLREKHGNDYHAMVLDTKINRMQLSAGQIRKLDEGYMHWHHLGEKARHGFRGPQKPYKRL